MSDQENKNQLRQVLPQLRALFADADQLWATLPPDLQNEINGIHHEEGSIGHCIRYGGTAIDEAIEKTLDNSEQEFLVITFPSQEDIIAFRDGATPPNVLHYQFNSAAEVSAYRQGIEAIEDESDWIDGLSIIGATVSFTRRLIIEDDLDMDDAAFEEISFVTEGEAAAYCQGVSDSEGMRAPFVVTADDEDFPKACQLLATLSAPSDGLGI